MFLTPQPTPLDLRMRLLWTDVRIHPGFWLMSVILGWGLFTKFNVGYLMLWILVVLFSILVHEFGHVGMGRLFGSDSFIVLYAMGGLAVGIEVNRRWKRILVLLGGPVAQLILYGVVLVAWNPILYRTHEDYLMPVIALLQMLEWVNLYWALMNLVPIFPLDGGQIMKEVLEAIFGRRGFAHALLLSTALAAVIAINALMTMNGKPLIPFLAGFGSLWTVILFGMLAVSSFQMWQIENDRGGPDDRLPWE